MVSNFCAQLHVSFAQLSLRKIIDIHVVFNFQIQVDKHCFTDTCLIPVPTPSFTKTFVTVLADSPYIT